MGRIWLCEDQMARRPLMVNAGISLYSFEELCYYLYQNVESVEESFFNELLCQWLAEELDRQELSQQLLEGLEQEKSGCWCLEQILNEGGFYNIEQMNAVLQIAESMEKIYFFRVRCGTIWGSFMPGSFYLRLPQNALKGLMRQDSRQRAARHICWHSPIEMVKCQIKAGRK